MTADEAFVSLSDVRVADSIFSVCMTADEAFVSLCDVRVADSIFLSHCVIPVMLIFSCLTV